MDKTALDNMSGSGFVKVEADYSIYKLRFGHLSDVKNMMANIRD